MPPKRIAGRVEVVRRSRGLDLTQRRLLGTSARADRAFFLFLDAARRAVPEGTRGVALYARGKAGTELYLAAYTLDPVPVRFAPREVPPGWVRAFYGPPPDGWSVVRELPGGAIAEPPRP
jgi:hypothetical protein